MDYSYWQHSHSTTFTRERAISRRNTMFVLIHFSLFKPPLASWWAQFCRSLSSTSSSLWSTERTKTNNRMNFRHMTVNRCKHRLQKLWIGTIRYKRFHLLNKHLCMLRPWTTGWMLRQWQQMLGLNRQSKPSYRLTFRSRRFPKIQYIQSLK